MGADWKPEPRHASVVSSPRNLSVDAKTNLTPPRHQMLRWLKTFLRAERLNVTGEALDPRDAGSLDVQRTQWQLFLFCSVFIVRTFLWSCCTWDAPWMMSEFRSFHITAMTWTGIFIHVLYSHNCGWEDFVVWNFEHWKASLLCHGWILRQGPDCWTWLYLIDFYHPKSVRGFAFATSEFSLEKFGYLALFWDSDAVLKAE